MVTVRTHPRDAGLALGELLVVVALAVAMVVGGVVVARSQHRDAAAASVRGDVEGSTPYVTVAMGFKPVTYGAFFGVDATGFIATDPPYLSRSAGDRVVVGDPAGWGTFVIAAAHPTGTVYCFDSVSGRSGDDPSICQGMDTVALTQVVAMDAARKNASPSVQSCFDTSYSAYEQGWDVGTWADHATKAFTPGVAYSNTPSSGFAFPASCAEQYTRGYDGARQYRVFRP